MIKNHHTRRTIALFFIFSFLNTLVPYNTIYAQNNGPNAPEAAAFEPVDATDMVNLSTGGFTYVLPLLNIPSPEGGYPLALSYHAGIAMDQEASMIGLGWNLNPGAINRNVNGSPDDYNSALITEHFYDQEQKITEYNASIGYSFPGGSVGLGLSWGSHKSLGGHVSIGVGLKAGDIGVGINATAGTSGSSIGVGVKVSELTFGASLDSEGNLGGNLGFDKNGTGFSISTNGAIGLSFGREKSGNLQSLDVSLSSSGIGLSVSSVKKSHSFGGVTIASTSRNKTGTGVNFSFVNTSKMGDYATSNSGWSIPLFIPVGLGFLTFSFGKTEFKFSLNKYQKNYIDGPLHFYDGTISQKIWKVSCYGVDYYDQPRSCGSITTSDYQEATDYVIQQANGNDALDCECEITEIGVNQSYMDILELPVSSGDFSDNEQILLANPNFPNYDKFNVQAQGLSGAITARLFENKALFGISGQEDANGNNLDYVVNGESTIAPSFLFSKKPFFYFENEISTYLETPIANFQNNNNILNTFDGTSYSGGIDNDSKASIINRKKTGSFIEYYTNNEIVNEENRLIGEGYLKPNGTGFEREKMPSEGIGAFKITTVDGKTYHYSLPVYNHEILQRTYGVKDNYNTTIPRLESQSYFEKRQMVPYATHWLLTAITGPDFIDTNNDGIADENDYGYWVSFEYGKYSDGFVWTGTYGRDVLEDPNDEDVKTWIKGRKDQYYIDRIKTRTHTALFVKSQRSDAKSIPFSYKYATSNTSYSSNPSFTLPSQHPLKLDKILLVENNDDIFKSSGIESSQTIEVNYPKTGGKISYSVINKKDNVIDVGDDFSSINNRIIKSIEFDNNHYDLAKGTPYSDLNGRLTLESVKFKGKNESSIIPPYHFNYINSNYNFDIDDKDDFGYVRNQNELWSLNEIITPEGGKIRVDYEDHVIKPVTKSKVIFKLFDKNNKISMDYDGGSPNDGFQPRGFYIESKSDFGIKLGDVISIDYNYTCFLEEGGNCSGHCGHYELRHDFSGNGTVTQKLDENKFFVLPDNDGWTSDQNQSGSSNPINWNCDFSRQTASAKYTIENTVKKGGIRVKRVSTIDENNKYYSMDYTYGDDNNGIGYVTYLPYASELAVDLPYSSELPSPTPIYDYVTTATSVYENGDEASKQEYGVKTKYHFNVLKEKTEGEAKFGDFYEITSENVYGSNTSSNQLNKFTIKDNLGAIGQLLSVEVFNQKGQLLSSINNEYYKAGETPDKLGITQESYQTYKRITDSDNNVKKLAVASTRISYPALLKKSSELKGGNTYTSEFNDFDPISGQARKTYSYSSTGLKFLTKGIQAFRIPQYSKMGSKVDDSNNKNMLTQSAGSYSYILDENGTEQLIGVGITTWNNNWTYQFNNNSTETTNEVWRKHKTYVWNGTSQDGIYQNYTDNFNWAINGTQSPEWKKTSETTRYNQFSNPLEVKDVNENYAATKIGDDYSKVIATSNAAYDDMYYSGAEYVDSENTNFFDGGIKSTGYVDVSNRNGTSDAHTGNYVVEVVSGAKAFEVDVPARALRNTALRKRFKVSVWVEKGKENNVKMVLNGTQVAFNNSEKVYAGNWVLVTGYITISELGANVAITSTSGTVRLDDFRLHPISSSMSSYVYNEWDEVSYITGANGLSAHYIYDDAGRLIETQTELVDKVSEDGTGGFKRVSTNSYNYKNNQ